MHLLRESLRSVELMQLGSMAQCGCRAGLKSSHINPVSCKQDQGICPTCVPGINKDVSVFATVLIFLLSNLYRLDIFKDLT
jgi:hypothetical protein